MRGVFLREFDAMADMVAPVVDPSLTADPSARTEDVTELAAPVA